jgi:preprotein translocase subunit SecE
VIMASLTRTDGQDKSMSDDALTERDQEGKGKSPEPVEYRAPSTRTDSSGFFTIYKKGQGYWTRMGTAIGAALIGALIAHFLYKHLPVWNVSPKVTIGVAAGFFAAFALLAFWLMNKPTNADFLIATDSEMKKVNWTSRKELIGSTKVVIIFMLLIALFLFVVDQLFGLLFWLIHVIKIKPFFISG